MKTHTFSIKTLGCKVNQYESQVLRENLVRAGHKETDAKNADVVIINSCTVTGEADLKTRKTIRRVNNENPRARIFVTGCYVFLEEDIEGLRSLPGVYKLVGNKDKNRIPLMLGETESMAFSGEAPEDAVSGFGSHTRAFLKVQDGCDQDCAYCKVTIVRGASRSRPEKDILSELERLLSKGYREVVLTGICLGAWEGSHGRRLSDLLNDITGIKGDFRIRLSSIEPNYVDKELLSVMAGTGKICRHLHIPLQSGSDRMLALMRRRYNTAQFRDLVCMIREHMPLAGITTDVIVGFPGESDDDFRRTTEFIQDIRPSRLHVFSYSDRKGTAAHTMKDKVPRESSKIRTHELIEKGQALQREFCARFVGRTVEVLVEQKEAGDTLTGYTGEYVSVKIKGFPFNRGEIVKLVGDTMDEKEPVLMVFGQ